ncbi:heavy metal translocating P-type ATPase [Marivibrio halodurans]|uniref:Heavy metal translocating P-type ATPase n=1 Tax=Marivibrio halodurans TaxID=2039722 RepID=A0A8J7V2B9_9PROT|nr:heavy metal translocating P-type ATPase [Marivibrio halodurans]MBP5858676.1 heavy metal translocating P-type ATPase [Marivibrio halodurans]
MSCCLPTSESAAGAAAPPREAVLAASRDLGDGTIESHFAVPAVHCGGCIRAVEGAVGALAAVRTARLNLSTKRLAVTWSREAADPAAVFVALDRLGYAAHPVEAESAEGDPTLKRLILQLGVAGFAAGNIMLLSVSVWSGAEGTTRDLFHWISALIAIPAVAFSGQAFFRPAAAALARGRLTMDVPIALAVLLAVGLSLFETMTHGAEAYFDASVSLLFFLLIGRTLDHVMRERARSAASALARMTPRGARVVLADGTRVWRPLSEIAVGDRLVVAAGERVPVDARVVDGAGEVDCAIATGESLPVAAREGTRLPAGALNLSGPLTLEAEKPAARSFLAEMTAMLEAAESANPRFRRIADRAAAIYAPAVHLAALLTFLGWGVLGGDWYLAIKIAIAVLIITCPCALGLAVPIVQVVAAGRLFRHGILVRDGAGLERLAEIDRVVLDKTGTLTVGRPRLLRAEAVPDDTLALAGALAAGSRHPYSMAIRAAAVARGLDVPERLGERLEDMREEAGQGLTAHRADGAVLRLGRPGWAAPGAPEEGDEASVLLSLDGRVLARFAFEDAPRPGAAGAVAWLEARGVMPEILSGDRPGPVAATARTLGAARWRAGLTPAGKIDHIRALQAAGHRVLMVGDGINDAPAMSAADAAIAPGTAADIGRRAAGFVFLHEGLEAVPIAIRVARRAKRLVFQNFALAALYNMIAVPLAVAGHASPLVAALAMSGSSILVVANALRLDPRSVDRRDPASRSDETARRAGLAEVRP